MNSLVELLSYKNIDIFRGEEKILADVNINLHNAELLFVLGSSGSGKSTFLKSIYGEVQVRGDYAKVLEHNLLDIKPQQLPLLRRSLGLIFQDFKIFEKLTVYENLNYFLRSIKSTAFREIDIILEKVGLAEKRLRKGYELSGGEKQRLSVARALVHKPKLIIADEPTGNLNKDLGIDIFKLLKDLALQQGSSIIAATHDEELTRIFPARVFNCANGLLTRI